MDFFSRGYKGLLGEKGQTQSVEDTVVKLVDRASNSTLLEDRRAAILGLKGLSREYRQVDKSFIIIIIIIIKYFC